MLTPDALSKLSLQTLLAPFVTLRTQHTVSAPPQFADVFVASAPDDPRAASDALGHLALLVREPALLEVYSSSVSLDEARDCQRKQLTLHHEQQREASQAQGKPVRLPLLPLWLLSAGRPETLLREWSFGPAAGYPAGFYRLPVGMRIGLVVVRELAAERASLPLRLLGNASSRGQALAELVGLPQDDAMRGPLVGLLKTWRVALPELPEDEETKRLAMQFEEAQRLVREHNERLIEQGREVGETAGELREARKAVARVLSRRGLTITTEQQALLASCHDLTTLERWLDQAVTAAAADEALR